MIQNTEQLSSYHSMLDTYNTQDLVNAFVDDQANAVQAVQAAAASLAAAVDAAVPRIRAGGRLLYFGAGTSGRLAMLDCVELNPTFSWDKSRAVARLAGGDDAMNEAAEGAEDDEAAGATELRALAPTANDVVILVAASGRTPYVVAALQAARAAGALTIGIVNNPGSVIDALAEIPVVLDTGAEVISGSTRLKAGTAQKIALNSLSSAIMVRLHKVYGNLMVDMRATNNKLVRRALRLTVAASGATRTAAREALEACGYEIKTAIVVLCCRIDPGEARLRLAQAEGSVGSVVQSGKA
ncbi:N-acetylmuramic acid 6-phosphate etherase [Variovorax humicola]|uniref:N-acetylmuramic acid 6-phosphate etherase n=1 Tax=Variovorax humicola TaxID=1769758 RepID=UPI003BF57A73